MYTMTILSIILLIIALSTTAHATNLRGLSSGNKRIFNGNTVEDLDRYPYFAMLDGFPDLCGGALIAPDMIVTAAHCRDVSNSVIIGRSNKVDYEGDSSETLTVSSQTFFPLYPNPSNANQYDLMLVQLDGVSTKPTLKVGYSTPSLTDRLTTVGFGMLNPGRLVFSSTLQEAELDYIANDHCQALHVQDIEITDDLLCAHREGTSTCYGDGGGPLIQKGATPADDVLVGTVSQDSCDYYAPGIYSNVAFYYDWIVEMVCRNSVDPPEYMGCGAVGALEDGTQGEGTQSPNNPLNGPVTGTLQFMTWNLEAEDLRLDLCQGDCDSDSDCAGDLVCFKRNSNSPVPGCQVGGFVPSVSDFCIHP